ncbi:MAG: TraK family protein [Brevundimonas sp.]
MTGAAPITRGRSGKAAYFAIRADVEAKIAKGICILAIFDEHREKLPIGYSQFARYVQRYSGHAKFDPPATRHGQ